MPMPSMFVVSECDNCCWAVRSILFVKFCIGIRVDLSCPEENRGRRFKSESHTNAQKSVESKSDVEDAGGQGLPVQMYVKRTSAHNKNLDVDDNRNCNCMHYLRALNRPQPTSTLAWRPLANRLGK